MPKTLPAQQQLVHKHLDWLTVEQRLNRFPAIARTFPLDQLRRCTTRPPYYCHYMAWRLGTWKNDVRFARLNDLLVKAEALNHWSSEASLLASADFAEFWSLIWQLQVAEYLCEVGSNVSWCASGPDLSAEVEGERWFVECYAYRKSFGLVNFLKDVLASVDSSVCVDYDLCMPLSLPSNSQREEFLDRVLSPFLSRTFLDEARSEAEESYPVVLGKHESGLVVYMDGQDSNKYVPGRVPNRVGDPEKYLKVALTEALRAKQNANALATHRPNLLVVNYLLSADFQIAIDRAQDLSHDLPAVDLGANIDALGIAAAGIDEKLSFDGLRCAAARSPVMAGLHRIVGINR